MANTFGLRFVAGTILVLVAACLIAFWTFESSLPHICPKCRSMMKVAGTESSSREGYAFVATIRECIQCGHTDTEIVESLTGLRRDVDRLMDDLLDRGP